MEVEVRRNVLYCTHDGVDLAGDLFLPRDRGPHAALIGVHGGAWRAGARQSLHNWGHYFAAKGIAYFSVNYRLATKQSKAFPQAVHDIVAAVQFLRGEAAIFDIDPTRIGLMGASAGAHLSALVALGTQSDAFLGVYREDKHCDVDAKVKALIGVFGVYDMATAWNSSTLQSPGDNPVDIFLGVTPMDDRKIYFDASPLSYAVRANNKVAVLLAWGTEDDVVDCKQQSEPFMLALKQSGFFVRSTIVPFAPHFWTGDPIDEPGSFTGFLAPRLDRFLRDHL